MRSAFGFIALAAFASHAAAQPVATEQTSGTTALLIAVSPVNENIVWVSGAAGTWLRTTDGGTTWQTGQVPGAESLQFRDVHAVDANTAYLLSIGEGEQSRIYRTTDAGRNWTLQFTNQDPQGFYDCFDFWDARRGIVIGDVFDGAVAMLATTDGTRWTRLPRDIVPAAPNGEGSFAASGTCLITRDGGVAWVVASNAERGRLLHTNDFGRTWTTFPLPITTRSGVGPQSVSFRDATNGMVLGGGNTAEPADVLAAATDDGGRTWSPRTRPPLQRGVWGGMYVPGTRTLVAVGPNGAVLTTDDGGTWSAINENNYWSLGFASARAGWLVGARGRITKVSGFEPDRTPLLNVYAGVTVDTPPPGFDPFYAKYLDAEGIPILGSANVSNAALHVARDIVNFMLAHRPDARASMIRQGFRLVVMAQSEQTTDVPEHSLWTVPARDDWRLTQGERERYDQPGGLGSQTPKQYWDRRARGMDDNPTTCAEENVLGIPGTRYFGENICVHEFVHSIMMYGLQFSDPALFAEVEAAWAKAVEEGLWQGHYARTNAKEYFAEAAQTYFWSNYEFSDGDRRIQSPEDLKTYDPRVYELLTRVFPDGRIPMDAYHGRNLRPGRRGG